MDISALGFFWCLFTKLALCTNIPHVLGVHSIFLQLSIRLNQRVDKFVEAVEKHLDRVFGGESGVMKMIIIDDSAVSAGSFVMNSAETGVKLGDCAKGVSTLKKFAGSSYILGMALQTSAASGDECLVLLGKYS